MHPLPKSFDCLVPRLDPLPLPLHHHRHRRCCRRRLLPYLQGKQVGIINASVLSMGLLTHQVRRHWGFRNLYVMSIV